MRIGFFVLDLPTLFKLWNFLLHDIFLQFEILLLKFRLNRTIYGLQNLSDIQVDLVSAGIRNLMEQLLGVDTLCRHNFEHNTIGGAWSIMPA